MKHIIIEGGDRLGKSTLIEGITKHFNHDNVIIRHFSKPPSDIDDVDPFEFQQKCFDKEGFLSKNIHQMDDGVYSYYENILIWNRSHLGEYVYGQMFRGQDKSKMEEYILDYEIRNLSSFDNDIYLVLLSADNAEFFLSKEDGQSLSTNLEQKQKELKMFDEVFELSSISKKIKINVNDGLNYQSKEHILNTVLDFIKYKNIL